MKLAILGASPESANFLACRLSGFSARELPQPLQRIVQFDGKPSFAPEDLAGPNHYGIDSFRKTLDALETCEAELPENHLLSVTLTPLQIAVVQDVLLGDSSLYPLALQHHSHYAVHLLLGHDGAEATGYVRQIEVRLRDVMERYGIEYATIYGQGVQQAQQALSVISSCLAPTEHRPQSSGWCWNCESCSDSRCEHQLFSALIGAARTPN